jgi:hypothetical protein
MALPIVLFELKVIGVRGSETNIYEWLRANIRNVRGNGTVVQVQLSHDTLLHVIALPLNQAERSIVVRGWILDTVTLDALGTARSCLIMQDLWCALERRGYQVSYWRGILGKME